MTDPKMRTYLFFFGILTSMKNSLTSAQENGASGVTAGFPTKDCGATRGCIGFPDEGCLATGKCTILLKFAYDVNVPDKIPVEIFGTPPPYRPHNFWIAVGFNPEPQKMGGALVTECVYNNGGAGVFTSRNLPNGYLNQRIRGASGVLPGNGTLHAGILGCSFVLDRVRTVEDVTYDLGQPYYLVAGNGPALGSGVRQHFQRPFVSVDAIVLAPQDDSSGSTAPTTTFRGPLFDKFLQNPLASTTMHTWTAIRGRQSTRAPVPVLGSDPSDGLPADQVPDLPITVPGDEKTQRPSQERMALSHTRVVHMIMRFIEPPIRLLIDLLNRGVPMRMLEQ